MIQNAKSTEEIRRTITTVPWGNLAHAYHGAWDAPAKLEVFLNSDSSEDMLDKAVSWMWSSILHQGSIYSASTPVLWILIDLIAARPDHPATASILYSIQTVTDGLLYFNDNDEPPNPVQQNAPGEPVYEAWTHNALPTSADDIEYDGAEDNEYKVLCALTKTSSSSEIRKAIEQLMSKFNRS